MSENLSLQSINTKMLTPLVQEVCHNKTVEITEWQHEKLQGGTVAEVYRIKGIAQPDRVAPVHWSLILKIQRQWHRSGDPECWQREKLLYESGLFDTLPETLQVPYCFEIYEKYHDEQWFWLEDVTGQNDTQMTLEDYCLSVRHLAHFQGPYLNGYPLPAFPWLSTRRWVANTVANWGTEAIPYLQEMQRRPETDCLLPQKSIDDILKIWNTRDDFLDIIDHLPRTVCHRDFNAANMFVRNQSPNAQQSTVIDWDCTGIGAIGEDISDLVGEALVYFDFDLNQANILKEEVISNYVSGLRDIGWTGDESIIRRGYEIHAPLQWCFRTACRLQNADDQITRERCVEIQRFMIAQAANVIN